MDDAFLRQSLDGLILITFCKEIQLVVPGVIEKMTYPPAVARHWLLLLAGLLWSGVGATLCLIACFWLSHQEWPQSGMWAALGVSLGACAYRLPFSSLARKNIRRIAQQPDRVCLFAFQAWRSYLLIIFMALLGFVLRQTPLSRPILAAIYLAVGTGLLLSSVLYYHESM